MLRLYDIVHNPNFIKCAILVVGFGQLQNSELTLISPFLCNMFKRSYTVCSATWRVCSISDVQMSGVPCVVRHGKERPYKANLTLNQALPLAADRFVPYWWVRKNQNTEYSVIWKTQRFCNIMFSWIYCYS